MAATYYYRASGRLPLCLVTTGAGSANAITGVIAAWMDSIPLIVISGNEPSRYFGDRDAIRVHGTQGYDSAKVAAPFCKYTVQIRSAASVITNLESARARSLQDSPGPVWVDIPKDIQNHAVQG